MGAIHREFLGWNACPVERAAAWLLSRAPKSALGVDLSHLLVVVSSSRGGRVLLAAMVESTHLQGRALLPSRIVTPGVLKELLTPPGRLATPLQRRCAVARTLAELDADRARALSPSLQRPTPGDRLVLSRLVLASLDRLASMGLRAGEAARRLPRSTPEEIQERIEALSIVQDRAELVLGDCGLVDPGAARRAGVVLPAGTTEIVLVGVGEMDTELRGVLGRAGAPVVACVLAPKERADDFDDAGCVRPEAWIDRPIDLLRAEIRFVDTQQDLCDAALGSLAALPPGTRLDEAVVCTPDPDVGERLATRAGDWRARLRPGTGRPVACLSPGRLLQEVRRFHAEGSFQAWGDLLRQGDMERALVRLLGHPPDAREHWLQTLDAYALEHLPTRVLEPWRDEPARELLAPVLEATATLLGPAMPGRGEPRNSAAWAQDLGELLERVYAGAGAPSAGTQGALRRLAGALDAMARVPDALGEGLDAGEALGLLLEVAGEGDVPREEDDGAVDVLGWLELTLDAAKHVVVAGLNEGVVPARRGLDALLPPGLLRALEASDAGAARDAYLLTLLDRSRESLTILVPRRDAQGEPLAPSRLVLWCGDRELIGRVRAWCPGDGEPRPSLPRPGAPARGADFPRMPLDLTRERIPTRWPVTSFREYLASPYLFYARRVLRAREVEASGTELGAGAFGQLLHDVLAGFARTPLAGSPDESTIRACLRGLLDERLRGVAGNDPSTAVAVQGEQARRRLEAYAQWQARRTREGWRVLHAEWSPGEEGVALAWDGGEVRLVGRIDRIDVHPEQGAALMDFKTADTTVKPGAAHQARGRWIDLQLPLYRHLAAGPIASQGGPVELAYLSLGADGEATYAVADWDAAALAQADAAAREVVRRVHDRAFALEGERPPEHGPIADLLGRSFAASEPDEGDDP